MMRCFVNFVVFVVLCRKILSHPTDSSSRTSPRPFLRTTLPNTEHMVQMGRGIEGIPRGRISVKTLNLAYNHISTLPEFVFHNSSFKSLTRIDLHQNKIGNISLLAFRGLRQLTSVDLADNNITFVDPYSFKHNPRLEKLDLSNNRISFNRLQVFLISQSLETLILVHNKIEQIYELTFMGLPNLKTLILDYNTIFVIAPNSFKPLHRLQYLSLSNTGVYRLSASMFEDLPRVIDLQETPLAKRFDPPLKKVTDNAVRNLINIDQYIYVSDMPV